MRAPAVAIVLVMLAGSPLAGCLGSTGTDGTADPANATDPGGANGTEKVAFQQDAPDSAKQGGRHRHDPWQGQDTKLIFDGSVEAGDCYSVFTPLIIVFNAAFRQEAAYGCAWVRAENGTTVPQGTGKLKVETDAADARQQGGYQLTTYTNDRSLQGTIAQEDQHTWWFELQEQDWDLPHEERTGFAWFYEARGDVAVLDGPMDVRITAHKIPNWTPPLAEAHLDHWQLDDRHKFVHRDAIELMNRTETVTTCSWAQYVDGSCEYQEPLNLSDIVPPGTKQVALALEWDGIEGCAPAHNCSLDAYVRSGESEYAWNEPFDQGEGYLVYLYDVPDDVVADSTYANESKVDVVPDLYQCIESGDTTPFQFNSCGLGNANWAPQADVHFTMEAWRTGVNVQDFKDRRGIGA